MCIIQMCESRIGPSYQVNINPGGNIPSDNKSIRINNAKSEVKSDVRVAIKINNKRYLLGKLSNNGTILLNDGSRIRRFRTVELANRGKIFHTSHMLRNRKRKELNENNNNLHKKRLTELNSNRTHRRVAVKINGSKKYYVGNMIKGKIYFDNSDIYSENYVRGLIQNKQVYNTDYMLPHPGAIRLPKTSLSLYK